MIKNKKGFSLVEVMLLFLTIAIILAASIPLITKKTKLAYSLPHGAYRCYALDNGKFMEERFSPMGRLYNREVDSCSLDVPKAGLYKIQMFTAGTGGFDYVNLKTTETDPNQPATQKTGTYTLQNGYQGDNDIAYARYSLEDKQTFLEKMLGYAWIKKTVKVDKGGNGGDAQWNFQSIADYRCRGNSNTETTEDEDDGDFDQATLTALRDIYDKWYKHLWEPGEKHDQPTDACTASNYLEKRYVDGDSDTYKSYWSCQNAGWHWFTRYGYIYTQNSSSGMYTGNNLKTNKYGAITCNEASGGETGHNKDGTPNFKNMIDSADIVQFLVNKGYGGSPHKGNYLGDGSNNITGDVVYACDEIYAEAERQYFNSDKTPITYKGNKYYTYREFVIGVLRGDKTKYGKRLGYNITYDKAGASLQRHEGINPYTLKAKGGTTTTSTASGKTDEEYIRDTFGNDTYYIWDSELAKAVLGKFCLTNEPYRSTLKNLAYGSNYTFGSFYSTDGLNFEVMSPLMQDYSGKKSSNYYKALSAAGLLYGDKSYAAIMAAAVDYKDGYDPSRNSHYVLGSGSQGGGRLEDPGYVQLSYQLAYRDSEAGRIGNETVDEYFRNTYADHVSGLFRNVNSSKVCSEPTAEPDYSAYGESNGYHTYMGKTYRDAMTAYFNSDTVKESNNYSVSAKSGKGYTSWDDKEGYVHCWKVTRGRDAKYMTAQTSSATNGFGGTVGTTYGASTSDPNYPYPTAYAQNGLGYVSDSTDTAQMNERHKHVNDPTFSNISASATSQDRTGRSVSYTRYALSYSASAVDQEPLIHFVDSLYTRKYTVGTGGKAGNFHTMTTSDLGNHCTFTIPHGGPAIKLTENGAIDPETEYQITEAENALSTTITCKKGDDEVFTYTLEGPKYPRSGLTVSSSARTWNSSLQSYSMPDATITGESEQTQKVTGEKADNSLFVKSNFFSWAPSWSDVNVSAGGSGTQVTDRCAEPKGSYAYISYYNTSSQVPSAESATTNYLGVLPRKDVGNYKATPCYNGQDSYDYYNEKYNGNKRFDITDATAGGGGGIYISW